MDQDTILLWAEAKRAGIEDYRKIPVAQLRAMIGNAKGKGSAPAKGKAAATNGRRTNGAKGKAAATRVVKGKAVAAPAKGKTTPTKGKATVTKPVTRKAAPAKGKVAAKPKATTATKPRATRAKAAESYVVRIENKSIDWKAPWNGGTTGKRGVVMDALRKAKGDKAKVFAEVKRNAVKWYPYPTLEKAEAKHKAERMVVWLIGRVALDFVKATGQHESGQRAGYGTSTKPNDIRRREARAAAASTQPRRRAAAKPAASRTAAGKGKAAPATRKPAAGRTTAPKGKAVTKAPTRKPAVVSTRSRTTAARPKGKGIVAKGRR